MLDFLRKYLSRALKIRSKFMFYSNSWKLRNGLDQVGFYSGAELLKDSYIEICDFLPLV